MIARGTEISEFKTTTGSLVGAPQEVKAHAVKNEKDMEKAQETVAVSDS